MNIAEKAKVFAIAAHAAVNQKRKYTGDDYHVHPINVAHMVESVSDDIEMMAAAYLHDVVEDTAVTVELIEVMFGSNIAALVDGLTDKSKPSDGNRAVRKAIDSDNLARQCPNVKTIKLVRDECIKYLKEHKGEIENTYLKYDIEKKFSDIQVGN